MTEKPARVPSDSSGMSKPVPRPVLEFSTHGPDYRTCENVAHEIAKRYFGADFQYALSYRRATIDRSVFTASGMLQSVTFDADWEATGIGRDE